MIRKFERIQIFAKIDTLKVKHDEKSYLFRGLEVTQLSQRKSKAIA